MLVKIYLFVSISVVFLYCSQNQQYNLAKVFARNLTLSDLPKNYEVLIDNSNKKNQIIYIFNKSKKELTSGEIFQFTTNTPFYVRYFELLNYSNDSLNFQCFFKLYINNKLIGKYKVGEKIVLNTEISAIKILFLKTKNEYLIKGWSGNTIFKILKVQANQKSMYSPNIKLYVNADAPIYLKVFSTRMPNSKSTLGLNKQIIKKFTIDNNLFVSGLHYKKNGSQIIQYNIRLFENGFFSIYQLVSNRLTKKLVYEFFFEGYWYSTKLNSDYVKIVFDGKFSGYFPNEKEKFAHNKKIKIQATLKEQLLKSDKLLAEIYFDFPEDAFVNVKSLIPDIQVEMPYASSNNFTGEQLYPCNKCFLRYKVAKALIKVQTILKKKQMSLKLFDCYRPFSVQAIMFKKFPIPGYVADSIGGSVHNRGSAVDLSIIDKNGKALDMGTEYDELSPKSNHNYRFFTDTILKNRLFLKELMQANNFVAIRSEWWHYNFVNARKFVKVNDAFLCN